MRRFLALALVLAVPACATQPPVPAAETPAPAAAPPPPPVVADTVPAWRKQLPALSAPKPLAFPPVETRRLANGLTIHVVEHRELPVADFVLVVGTGAEADPARHVGLATMTAQMLTEGAGRRRSLDIADQEAFLGIELSAGSGWDASRIALHTPTAQLDSALALFADVALRPTFPANELDRLKRERLTTLLQLRDRGPEIANVVYSSLLFGAEHPYGRSLIGTEASTRRITRADVRRFYDSYFRPNNATLIVVGDVTADDVERRVQSLFGRWARRAIPTMNYRTPPAAGSTMVYLVDKPGAPQSSVRIGAIGVARSTEDYFPLLVMNTILGGSFTSRLNNNLRETKGYTYGASSGFGMRRAPGPFTARAEIVAAKTDSSLIEFMKELRSIRDTVSGAELLRARRFLQLQLPGDFETTGDIASQLVPVVLYGLPLDYYGSYVQRIEDVTQADVQRVAQRYIDPSKLTIVIVGDRKSLEPSLRELGLGEVSVRDISGRLVQ